MAFVLAHKPGDVSHPDVEFTTERPTRPGPAEAQAVDAFLWPTYGYRTTARATSATRRATSDRASDAAGRTAAACCWSSRPTIDGGSLYVLDDDGILRAIDKTSGQRPLAAARVGRLAAASPRSATARVYAVALRGIGSETGRVAAYRASDGAAGVVEGAAEPRRVLAAARARPPLLRRRGRHRLRARRAQRPHDLDLPRRAARSRAARRSPTARSTSATTAARSTPCARRAAARCGRSARAARASASARARFYSTPAVAFGRVYLGNTDGRVYSFAASSGKLAWATGTGAYVYASPAVADDAGPRPDGLRRLLRRHLLRVRRALGRRALDASPPARRSPARRRSSANVVYFSVLQPANDTFGLNVRTGKQVFKWPDGAFNPVVADRRAIYLAGYGEPLRAAAAARDAEVAPSAGGGRARRAQGRRGAAPPLDDRPHRHAGRGEVRLDLGDRVVAVVEDRGAQDGVGAGLQRLDEVRRARPRRRRRSPARRPPRRTARVSSRS